jgi:AraC family transcriptional activator FtrA
LAAVLLNTAEPMPLSHLDRLEADAIHVIREVAAECARPVLLYSIGKDSSVLLHLVRKDFGTEAANQVARRLVMPPHRSGGQAQFIERPVPVDRLNRLAGVLEQMRADLRTEWSVARMAAAASMSPRTFLRRFTETTGQAPGQWLIAERVAQAQSLLESSALPIERVAEAVGFGSVQALRHHFQARVGLAPRDYRRAFGRP